MRRVLLLPGDDGSYASVVVLEDDGAGRARRVRRLRVALDLSHRCRAPPTALPDAELKVDLAGDLLCVEYRET